VHSFCLLQPINLCHGGVKYTLLSAPDRAARRHIDTLEPYVMVDDTSVTGVICNIHEN